MGEAGGLHPRGDAPRRRPRAARDGAVPGPAPLPALLAADAGHGPRQRHQRGHLHDEVQPQDARGTLPRATRADVHPWQDEETLQGAAGDRLRVPASTWSRSAAWTPSRCSRGGGSHAVFTNACVMRALLRGPRRAGPARRDDHDDLLAPLRRRRRRWSPASRSSPCMPDENGYPDLEAFKAAVSRADRRLHDHQPRGHRHLQPADRQVRRGRCTTPAPWPSPTRPTPTASWASRGRATPASTPATSTCTRPSRARTAARARPPAPTCAPTSWRRTCRCRS